MTVAIIARRMVTPSGSVLEARWGLGSEFGTSLAYMLGEHKQGGVNPL